MNPKFFALLGGLMALGSATEASATILTYTFTGTVSEQGDDLNTFKGVNYTGQMYTAVQTFDLSKAPPPTTTAGATVYSGGPGSGTADFGTSVLTVGDTPGTQFKETNQGQQNSELFIVPNYEIYASIEPYNFFDEGNVEKGVDQDGIGMIGDGMTPGTYALTSASSGDYYVEQGFQGTSYFAFTPTQVVVAVSGGSVSPVPLPASAPLFGAALLGLAVAGYGLKRRSVPAA